MQEIAEGSCGLLNGKKQRTGTIKQKLGEPE